MIDWFVCVLPPAPHRSCGWEGSASAHSADSSLSERRERHAPAGGLRFSLATRGAGPVMAYSSAAPAAVEVAGGGRVAFEHDAASGALCWEVPPGMALDLEWSVVF